LWRNERKINVREKRLEGRSTNDRSEKKIGELLARLTYSIFKNVGGSETSVKEAVNLFGPNDGTLKKKRRH